ncbi:MAG: metal-dependent transcriptional regulator [archaeon GB-1867-097]|nr:metal-dependent transcriptional regulator [Candidatus Culexmicrobium thermophilum]MCS7385065.1 metal-dependent transcriptional regulator [Candidatus Culexmicrobium thermophilum]HDO20980.1 metal-dependent transcriptional regulator [Candidatus Bathyarchaeota archaeon]
MLGSEAVENYLEAIYLLVKRKGYAKMSDISSLLNVKMPTATEMIQKLAKRGLVKYEKYKSVKLTSRGEAIAENVIKRHETLRNFLEILGVRSEIAEEDACRIEHYVHPETMKLLSKFVEFVQNAPRSPRWLEHFKKFCESGEHPPCKESEFQ